jgi:hypothetical protein
MNVNETYIRMCEKAPEVWDGRKFEKGDCVVAKNTDDGIKDGLFIAGYDDFNLEDQLAFGGLWFIVFRQFQLQSMVKRDTESWLTLDIRFSRCVANSRSYEAWSTEQRWLAFVMKKNSTRFGMVRTGFPTKKIKYTHWLQLYFRVLALITG